MKQLLQCPFFYYFCRSKHSYYEKSIFQHHYLLNMFAL